MTCEQCGASHRADVQFKTDDDWQEVYENGQQIPEDDGLAPGQSFAGYVNRFCPDCDRRWRADFEGKTLDFLARNVDQDRLVIHSKGAPAPHTAEELRALGRETRRAILDELTDGKHFLGSVFHMLTWDGEAVDFSSLGTGATKNFIETLGSDVGKALKATGWPRGADALRVGLEVCIGDDRKIFVQTAGGVAIG